MFSADVCAAQNNRDDLATAGDRARHALDENLPVSRRRRELNSRSSIVRGVNRARALRSLHRAVVDMIFGIVDMGGHSRRVCASRDNPVRVATRVEWKIVFSIR
jgi:hypothetical protein